MSVTKSAVVAGMAALGLAVAGCGGTAPSPSGRAPTGSTNVVLAAYTDTLAAKSARVTVHETVSVGRAAPVTVSGSGVVDFGGKEAEFAFGFPGGGTAKEVLISPELYVQLPAKVRSQVPGGKPWISLDLDRLSEARLGASLSQLSSSSQTPTQTLSYLESVSNGVKEVGTPTLNGQATTKYDATVDLTKVAATKSAAARAAVSKLESELHRSTIPVQVWIDHQHRVRQIGYQISVTPPTGPTVHTSLTMDLSSYGATVTVTAPPPSQTYDATAAALRTAATTG